MITGASSGLCSGVALALARFGYDLVLTFRATDPQPVVQRAREAGATVHTVRIDFDDSPEIIARSLAALVAEYSIDVLVHGVGPMTTKRFSRSAFADYEAMLNGNLRSAVLCAQALLPGMRERKYGRLIFFAMNHSDVTQPVRGLSLHAAAKSGLVAFAKTLALEEGANGITVNVVAPGDIRDKQAMRAQARLRKAQNPVGRPGSWEDVADAVRFLIAADADFFNGVVLHVNGGLAEPYERNAERP